MKKKENLQQRQRASFLCGVTIEEVILFQNFCFTNGSNVHEDVGNEILVSISRMRDGLIR